MRCHTARLRGTIVVCVVGGERRQKVYRMMKKDARGNIKIDIGERAFMLTVFLILTWLLYRRGGNDPYRERRVITPNFQQAA